PPGAMKSALLAQAAICVGAGLDWHGYRNKGAAGVVYFAIERADLVKRRLRAHRRILGLAGTPIAVSSSTIDLTHPEAFKKVVDTIRDAKTRRARNGRTITLPEHAGKLLPRSKGSRQKTTNCAAPIVTTPASLEFKTGGLQRWSADLPKLNASLRA
ncbi:MAG: hypothetical protein ACXVAM_19430, partial [Vulcanimicrobiaceae bacterium]